MTDGPRAMLALGTQPIHHRTSMGPLHPNPHDPGWGPTLRASGAILLSMALVSACFWLSSGLPELQARKARLELSDVATAAAFDQAFDRLVNCSDSDSCVFGSTLSTRLGAFWSAARSTGAIRFARGSSASAG